MQEGNTRGTDRPSNWPQMPSTMPYQRARLSPMEEGNTRGTDKPSHWSHMPSTTPYQRVRLSPITDEFKEIENFSKTRLCGAWKSLPSNGCKTLMSGKSTKGSQILLVSKVSFQPFFALFACGDSHSSLLLIAANKVASYPDLDLSSRSLGRLTSTLSTR